MVSRCPWKGVLLPPEPSLTLYTKSPLKGLDVGANSPGWVTLLQIYPLNFLEKLQQTGSV
jgi:hypothetical protein